MGLTLVQWAAIASIFGVILGSMKKVRAIVSRYWVRMFGASTKQLLKIHISDEESTLAEILAELKPNGDGSLRDAIDRVEVRQKDFEAFQTASLNIHDEAVFRTNLEGKVTFTNRAHQRLTGFSQGEAYGDGWINYLDPSERVRMKTIWEEAVAGGRELNEDILFIKPDHSTYMVRAHVYRETDSEGRMHGYLGVIYPLDESTGCVHKDTCIEHFQSLLDSRV